MAAITQHEHQFKIGLDSVQGTFELDNQTYSGIHSELITFLDAILAAAVDKTKLVFKEVVLTRASIYDCSCGVRKLGHCLRVPKRVTFTAEQMEKMLHYESETTASDWAKHLDAASKIPSPLETLPSKVFEHIVSFLSDDDRRALLPIASRALKEILSKK